jgi:pimeloyl-ACP methyl ester carboxylesterase
MNNGPDNSSLASLACPEATKINYVFTLIHGTWAPNSRWCQNDSELCSNLKSSFPHHIVERFPWKGSNSVEGRRKAAVNLASKLQDLFEKYPEAQHHIIAHSHGGNIACYALRDHPDLQQRVASLICLSTPFLQVQRRDKNHRQNLFVTGLSFIAILTAFAALLIESLAVFLGGMAIAMCALFFLINASNSCDKMLRVMRMPTPLKTPLLIVRTAADEATGALMACQVGIWIKDKVTVLMLLPSYLLQRVGRKIESLITGDTTESRGAKAFIKGMFGPGVTVLLVLFVLLPILVPVVEVVTYFKVAILFRRGELLPGLTDLPMILVAIHLIELLIFAMAVPLIFAPALMSFVTGPALALAYIYLDIYVEPAPPGRYTIYQFGLRSDLQERVRTWLNHSISYEAPEIIRAIIGWILNVPSANSALGSEGTTIAVSPPQQARDTGDVTSTLGTP